MYVVLPASAKGGLQLSVACSQPPVHHACSDITISCLLLSCCLWRGVVAAMRDPEHAQDVPVHLWHT